MELGIRIDRQEKPIKCQVVVIVPLLVISKSLKMIRMSVVMDIEDSDIV